MFNSRDFYYLIKRGVQMVVRTYSFTPETFQLGLTLGMQIALICLEDSSETVLNLPIPFSDADLARMSVHGLEFEDLWIVGSKAMREQYFE
jgi:hypothetical protein